MPPRRLRVPDIQILFGKPTNDQYSTIRNILYHFFVSIGYYYNGGCYSCHKMALSIYSCGRRIEHVTLLGKNLYSEYI